MKVILNYLPPGSIRYPSTSLSILQSFLDHKGYKAKTKYWNITMFRIMSYYEYDNDIIRSLFPFLSVIADEYNDHALKERLVAYLKTLKPDYKKPDDFYWNSLEEIRNSTIQLINSELDSIENNEVLFGISARFYQWIPGVILSKEIKRKYPQSKIVIGGLSSWDAATAMMNRFHDFDYAIWGEGEYPLLGLCNHLTNGSVEPGEIPRLVFREKDVVKTSKNSKSEYLDFTNYIFPAFDDYFESHTANGLPKDIVKIMINTISGCRWMRCSFCSYSQEKVFRERTAENIFCEIKLSSEKHGINEFYLADNDMVGKDIARFEKLLDLLIEYRKNINNKFHIYGEMIPTSQITPGIFSKMSLAGFTSLYIGYEAVTNNLLKKMKKENTFSENILFVKLALKFRIRPQVNIIQGIPDEAANDIAESMNNLHFLRFFFTDEHVKFAHDYSTLNLYKGTEYFRKMTEEEKKNYTRNPLTDYIPQHFIGQEDRFDFFSYRRNALKNKKLWNDFAETEKKYRSSRYTYEIINNDSSLIYKEFLDSKEIRNIKFNSPVFYEILKEAEYSIVSFDDMYHKLLLKYSDLKIDELKDYLNELKQNYIIYCDENYSAIVSVIYLNE
jgi:radical SAM superfamily enzyme YgiQ (UPF0313 family)